MNASQYGVIVADPPWSYRDQGNNGAAKKHYPTMTTADICNMPIRDMATDSAVLFLWGTWPLLMNDVRAVGMAWGFEYVAGFPWVKLAKPPTVDLFGEPAIKPAYGTGFWVRGCSEPVTIWRRKKTQTIQTNMIGVISERMQHSRKPETVYDLAALYPGRKLDLFARAPRAGWDVFGNEVENSIQIAGMVPA